MKNEKVVEILKKIKDLLQEHNQEYIDTYIAGIIDGIEANPVVPVRNTHEQHALPTYEVTTTEVPGYTDLWKRKTTIVPTPEISNVLNERKVKHARNGRESWLD